MGGLALYLYFFFEGFWNIEIEWTLFFGEKVALVWLWLVGLDTVE